MAQSLKNKKYVPAPDLDRPKMIFDLADNGNYGVKTGKGFFDYSDQSYEEVLRRRDKMLLKSVGLANSFIEDPLHNK